VIARGKTLDAIRARGIRIVTPSEDFTVSVNACSDPCELGVQDYIFVTLKAHQIDEALGQIASLMDSHTVVLPPTTGIPYYFFMVRRARSRTGKCPALTLKVINGARFPPPRCWAACTG
jgi:2-dehydropantoate 2-reductase